MEAKFVLVSCALLALFAASSADSTQYVAQHKRNDFEKAIANVEATFSEIYKSFVVIGDIILIIPLKGTKLIGIEALRLVKDVEEAFHDIGKFTEHLAESFEHLVVHDLMTDGTRNILMIIRTIRKTLQNIKKYLDDV